MGKKKRLDDNTEPVKQDELTPKTSVDTNSLFLAAEIEDGAEDPIEPIVEIQATSTEQDQPGDEAIPVSAIESPLPSVDELPVVPLKVFVRIAGPKWDQMAGFIRYAGIEKMGPHTVIEWRAAYQTFLRKPVS